VAVHIQTATAEELKHLCKQFSFMWIHRTSLLLAVVFVLAAVSEESFHHHYRGSLGRIITAEAWEGISVPHCCPPLTEIKIYRWRGSRFALVKTYRQRNEPYKNPKLFQQAKRCENFR
jgi:hypothetical protein